MRHAALCMTGLGTFEDISYTSQRLDQRLASFCIYLAAQAVDVNVDDVRVRLDPHAPHFRQQHGPGYDSACMTAEIFEKHELLRAQV
jgi:hypothetical protein